MDLPNELLHMILEFLPNNEHWSKFRQSSVRIYSLPTVREERSRYIGRIRELNRYENAVKRGIKKRLMCPICFDIFDMGGVCSKNVASCINCGAWICEYWCCNRCLSKECCGAHKMSYNTR